MITKLAGGTVHDPLNGIDGRVMDLWIDGGTIVAPPADGKADEVVDLGDKIVMPGGIDLHSHIGGGKVNIARMMLPEEHRDHVQPRQHGCRSGSGHYSPSTFTTGYAYARMGYTMAFEPAMLPINARQAHQEMADVPLLDKGAYVLLGNDDLFLKLVSEGAGADAIRDYVAWTLHATQALAVKIVNPGGISAFKFNGRKLDLDEAGPYYGIAPRQILTTLADALTWFLDGFSRFRRLPADAPGIAITQHMPERFTASLSSLMTMLSVGISCKPSLGERTQYFRIFFNSYGLSPNSLAASSGFCL